MPTVASAPDLTSFPDDASLAVLRTTLVARDPRLGPLDALTPALSWRVRPRGYPALIWMILGQQVSTISAQATWDKLCAHVGEVTPGALGEIDDDTYRTLGFSRQKARYVRLIAEAGIDFEALRHVPDTQALDTLTALTGVGLWTAEAYLLMSEGRLDVFPGGDIALQEAIRFVDALDVRPDIRAAYVRAEAWRPLRGVAAHLLWAWYVGRSRGR